MRYATLHSLLYRLRLHSIFIATFMTALYSGNSQALDLSAYQRPDGAITVYQQGDYVDPYFAIKALWAARQLGDPAPAETKAWINWLLPRQTANGRFARYCWQDETWRVCGDSDADDSLLAMWIELLYEASPSNLPSSWAYSIHRAERALESLRDRASGVYQVGLTLNDSLLMDNVEVYSALRRIGELQNRAGNRTKGQQYLARAHALKLAMWNTFRPRGSDILRWSNGDDSSRSFYPYAVAHLYPRLHQMDNSGFGTMLDWSGWLNRYGEEWLTRRGDNYPWGLIAMVAYHEQSYPIVNRWLNNAPALRYGGDWNVVEETVLQGLARARLGKKWD